jgi:hypothetical protein
MLIVAFILLFAAFYLVSVINKYYGLKAPFDAIILFVIILFSQIFMPFVAGRLFKVKLFEKPSEAYKGNKMGDHV